MAKKLGKYDIIERLGRGGMAEVYKGYQPSLDRFVAIKLLHPFLADDPEFKDRFEREARNVARLRHPNIVQVYDFDFDPESESYFMVMELIDGKTLKDHLNQLGDKLLPTDEVLRIMRGATEALAYAHARSMIHRDVKPANLMLDSDGRVVLTDFGIAKIVTGNQFTASGGMVGTPAFMAPEQGLGEAGDERSDLYSLGVILFEMVAGRLPYDGETPLAVILKHLNEAIPSVAKINPNVPPEIEAIVTKAMAKDPAERYQNAEEMLTQLNTVAGIKTDNTRPFVLPTGELESAEEDPEKTEQMQPTHAMSREITSTPGRGNPTATQTIAGTRPNTLPMNLFAVLVTVILGMIGISLATTGRLPFLFPPPTNTPTATATWTPSPTASFTPTATNTATNTPTATPSNSPTATPSNSPTASPTNTASATPTWTATSTPTLTPSNTPTFTSTPTPTANITMTLEAFTATSGKLTVEAFIQTLSASRSPTVDLTKTALVCRKEYRLIDVKVIDEKGGHSVLANPESFPIPAGKEFKAEITIRNQGDCEWEKGLSLNYTSGERFNFPLKRDMRNTESVRPGQDAVFELSGQTPAKGDTYSGKWEVRLAGGVLMNPPLTITFRVFE